VLGDAPSKTQLFRCFQIIQAPNIIWEFSPLRTKLMVAAFALSHQASNDNFVGCGTRNGDQPAVTRDTKIA
jgi:hypothetical protein